MKKIYREIIGLSLIYILNLNSLIASLILLFISSALAQTPQLIWEKPIYFQSSSKRGITGMYLDKFSNIYLSGYDTLNINPGYNGFIAKYNSNFDSLWRKYDPYVWSYDPKVIFEDKDRIIYYNINMNYSSDSTSLVCRSISNGNKLWQKTLKAYSSGRYGICRYGDSLILGSKEYLYGSGKFVKLLILNLNGDSLRAFNFNIDINQGSITLDNRDEFVWIKGNIWYAGNVSILSKVNLLTNTIVWTRYPGNFSASAKCYLDTNSNYYFCDSYFVDGMFLKYQLIKYDSSGNILWSKMWYPQPYGANINNWVGGVTVDELSNRVVIYGTTDKYEVNSSSRFAYYMIRNSINGDSLYSQIVIPPDTSYSTGNVFEFDKNGFLYSLYSAYKKLGPSYVKMRKYSLLTTNINNLKSKTVKYYSITQNFPNPFNPSTNIKFDIPKQSSVKLSIFDITGKELETPINEKLSPGSYETTWNASKYSSGIYFYRLQAGDFTETKRMILIK